MVAENALVPRHYNMVHQGTLSLQRDLVPTGLVDPAESEILVVLYACAAAGPA